MPDRIHTLVGNPSPGIEGNKRADRRSKPPVPCNGYYRIEYGSLLGRRWQRRPPRPLHRRG